MGHGYLKNYSAVGIFKKEGKPDLLLDLLRARYVKIEENRVNGGIVYEKKSS